MQNTRETSGVGNDRNTEATQSRPGFKLNFRGARLQTVLDQLRQSAGLLIGIKDGVQAERAIDLWHEQTVNTPEALSLLKESLVRIGCTLSHKGPLFSVIRSEDAKKHYIALPEIGGCLKAL